MSIVARKEHVVVQENRPPWVADDDVSLETKPVVQTNHVARRKTKRRCKKADRASRTTRSLYLTNDVVFLDDDVVHQHKDVVHQGNDVV